MAAWQLYLKVIVAGIFFGAWPLVMNRSGLTGALSGAAFSGTCFLVVGSAALATTGFTVPTEASGKIALASGLCGACGLLLFTNSLSRATPATAATMLVVVNLAQVGTAAAYQVFLEGISMQRLGGYFAAAIATYLLTR